MDAISMLAAACSANDLKSFDTPAETKVSDDIMEEDIDDNEDYDDDEDEDEDNNERDYSSTPISTVDGEMSPRRSGSRGKWTPEEDEILKKAVEKHGGRNWKKISDLLDGRTDVQCLHRWQKVLRPGLVKGPWTKEVRIANM